ncbi:unnamed protein product [Gemmataceae bacterium]|nr:unnamed protein product [Gemmataceae bacterium]VTT97697.1 unnamed protein product [Gemmataceae bacterium]
MIDIATQKPVRVLDEPGSRAHLTVRGEQVEPILKALQDKGIACWQVGGILSIDGAPGLGFIAIGINESAAKAQAVLDAVP